MIGFTPWLTLAMVHRCGCQATIFLLTSDGKPMNGWGFFYKVREKQWALADQHIDSEGSSFLNLAGWPHHQGLCTSHGAPWQGQV